MASKKQKSCKEPMVRYAKFDFDNVRPIESDVKMIRLASGRTIDGSSEIKSILKEEVAKHPNALFSGRVLLKLIFPIRMAISSAFPS